MCDHIITQLTSVYREVIQLEPLPPTSSPRTFEGYWTVVTQGVQFAGQILAHLRGVGEASTIKNDEIMWGMY
jgi:hypothetical protein